MMALRRLRRFSSASAANDTSVHSAHSASMGGASSHGAGRSCLICLDEDIEHGDFLLYNICKCRATAVHRSCLEQFVNSRRRRQRPLEQRIRCDICLQPYAVSYDTALITPLAAEAPPTVYRQPLLVKNMQVQLTASGLLALVLLCVARFIEPRFTIAVYSMLLLVLMIYIAHAAATARDVRLILRVAGRAMPRDPLTLDDEAFFAQVLVADRHAYLAQLERSPPADEAPEGMQRLILINDARLAGTKRRTAQHGKSSGSPARPGGRRSIAAREPALSHSASLPLRRGADEELQQPFSLAVAPPVVQTSRSASRQQTPLYVRERLPTA